MQGTRATLKAISLNFCLSLLILTLSIVTTFAVILNIARDLSPAFPTSASRDALSERLYSAD